MFSYLNSCTHLSWEIGATFFHLLSSYKRQNRAATRHTSQTSCFLAVLARSPHNWALKVLFQISIPNLKTFSCSTMNSKTFQFSFLSHLINDYLNTGTWYNNKIKKNCIFYCKIISTTNYHCSKYFQLLNFQETYFHAK